jgi:hypothetical protein
LTTKKKRDPYNFIKFTNLEPGGLTLLHKLTNVKSVIHGDGRDNCGFYTICWEHQQPTCDHHDIKIHFARNRHNFSTANIPCSSQKGWATTTSNVVRKAPKITQLEHKKKITQGTAALIYRQGRNVAKKHGRSSPVGFPPRPPVVAGGAHSGNFLVFVGGWFKFKLGYLRRPQVSSAWRASQQGRHFLSVVVVSCPRPRFPVALVVVKSGVLITPKLQRPTNPSRARTKEAKIKQEQYLVLWSTKAYDIRVTFFGSGGGVGDTEHLVTSC